jgi:deazaflavin-dependent oxidoreductase (nitroreductase family)
MATREYSALNALVQRIAATRPGAWFLSRTLHHLDRFVLSLTAGRSTLTGILAGAPVVILTTVGARSGALRAHPLLCIRDRRHPEQFALIATNWGQAHHPAWYYNLKANPVALCQLDGRSRAHIAREVFEHEYDRFWRIAVDTYAGFRRYKQRAGGRHIPIMVLEPL